MAEYVWASAANADQLPFPIGEGGCPCCGQVVADFYDWRLWNSTWSLSCPDGHSWEESDHSLDL